MWWLADDLTIDTLKHRGLAHGQFSSWSSDICLLPVWAIA